MQKSRSITAIGKKGQNVRLAAKLTGWRIDIKSEEEKRREVEAQFGALEVKTGDATDEIKTEDGNTEDGKTEDGSAMAVADVADTEVTATDAAGTDAAAPDEAGTEAAKAEVVE